MPLKLLEGDLHILLLPISPDDAANVLDGQYAKVLKAPHGEEGNRLKESVMYPGFYLGAAVGIGQFVFLRKAPIALMRRAGQTNFPESSKMKPFSILFDAALSAAMAGTVWIMTTDKEKVFKTASEIPLIQGKSDVSDALCDDFITHYETIRPDFWQNNTNSDGERGLRAISDFVVNCKRRQALERRLRREAGLGPFDPVSIPSGGVPSDFGDDYMTIDDGEEAEGIEWTNTERESAWPSQKSN